MVLSLSVLEKQRIPSSGAEFMLVKNPEAGSGVAGRCFPQLGGQQSCSSLFAIFNDCWSSGREVECTRWLPLAPGGGPEDCTSPASHALKNETIH